MTRKLPPSASIAEAQGGAKLCAPSALRNVGPINDVVNSHAPHSGSAMEIASGTGQHMVAFAQSRPDIIWQPTEIDAARRASIDAHIADARLTNVLSTITLDATRVGWGAHHQGKNLILLSNLLHLITTPEAQTVVSEAALALCPGGTLMFYGPFLRAGTLVSEGDRTFDSELRAADPLIGYKDERDILDWLSQAGLVGAMTQEMPANNLTLIARKPK